MNPIDVGALIVGLVLCLIRYAMLFPKQLNTKMFSVQIIKLVRANNIDRAAKLCAAAPNAFFPRMVRPVLDRLSAFDPSLGVSILKEDLRDAFSRARAEELGRARKLWWLPPLGVAIAVFGAASAFANSSPPLQIAFAPLVDLAVALASWRIVWRLVGQSKDYGGQIIAAGVSLHRT